MIPRFRVWDKIQRVMNDVVEIKYEYKAVVHGPPEERTRSLFKYVEVMQYLEWKDKEGKEVCESDIVECRGYYFEVIKEEDGSWSIRHDGGTTMLFKETFSKDFRVVGDKYQSPELLAEAE